MVHVPILRAGRVYRSLDVAPLTHVGTGEAVAEVSQANRGLIARDLLGAGESRNRLRGLATGELLAICRRAARIFAEEELPLDDGAAQSPEDYLRLQSCTTGMPVATCRANLEKIRFVLDEMERVLEGLTRGLDLSVLDGGFGRQDGRVLSYLAQTDVLGAVLPSNSPGVHSLWLPAIALKVPLVVKPGAREPWTPHRIARALQAAGCPPEAVSFYPTDHAGGAEILLRCGRSMLFGDESTLEPWREDPRVQLHGPGWSKVIFGEDAIDRWEEHLDLVVESIAQNCGRSCINASGVRVPSRGREVADALARRLASIRARPLDDPDACLAAFPEPEAARAISGFIDRLLGVDGAEDVTARFRGADRVVEVDGCTFLLPTLIRCDDPTHPLASTELLFPFATVVETPREEMLERIGPTLVATAITADPEFRRELLACPDIDRLNLGPIPTGRISWDQPHEGNLFDHLFRRRALQGDLQATGEARG